MMTAKWSNACGIPTSTNDHTIVEVGLQVYYAKLSAHRLFPSINWWCRTLCGMLRQHQYQQEISNHGSLHLAATFWLALSLKIMPVIPPTHKAQQTANGFLGFLHSKFDNSAYWRSRNQKWATSLNKILQWKRASSWILFSNHFNFRTKLNLASS